MVDDKIKNSNELEFAVFCIENVAAKLGVDAERVYQAFTEKSDILNGYIVPEYEVDGEELTNRLIGYMKKKNIKFEKLRNRKMEEKRNAQFLAYRELCISVNKYF